MTRKVHKNIDLGGVETFCVNTTVKKGADEATNMQLLLHGYRFPQKWRKPRAARQFIGWDGEGVTYDGDTAQSYVLFGASTGDRVMKPSLGTRDCFDLLLAVEQTYPDAIHVGFALQYDINMMLRDLSRRHLLRLYYTHKCRWEGYRIEYRPGKWLSLRKGNVRVRLFDVFGFFQSSFVTACEKFLGSSDPELVGVREGKDARRSFTYDALDTFIIPYWEAELRLLVRLMDSLRDDLDEAGLPIVSWHGPGAVANVVLRSNNVHLAKAESPKEINRAAQYAYAGGRFELFKCGHSPNPVWEYDINSAYPSAIAELPNLSKGHWEESKCFQPGTFSVWHVYNDDRGNPRTLFHKAQPIPHRDKHGNISYPPLVETWCWAPEAQYATHVDRGYVFVPDDADDKPFAFVRDMYETRLQWKKEGRSAERALKLALNSFYGKMAQRVGAVAMMIQPGEPESELAWTIPRWHQLEWAGYVTSMTRARLWSVLSSVPASTIVAVETDALFSTEPISSLQVGEGLGEWTETKLDWLTYVQSGMYYTSSDGKLIEKYRGFDKGSVSYEAVCDYLGRVDRGIICTCKPPRLSVDCPAHLFGETTRFIGMGLGLFTKHAWRSWVTEPRHVVLGGGGKRSHVPSLCPQCKHGDPLSSSLHTLSVITAGGRSYPHSLPWLSGQESQLRLQDELSMW